MNNLLPDFPRFTHEASCADALNPEIWFPDDEDTIEGRYAPSAVFAREICERCPARQECLEYSIQYENLSGIWAGLDKHERKAEQITRGITTKPVSLTIDQIRSM